MEFEPPWIFNPNAVAMLQYQAGDETAVPILPTAPAEAPPIECGENQGDLDVRMLMQLEDTIMLHPLYPKILETWFECRKVGEEISTIEGLEQHKKQLLHDIANLRDSYDMAPDSHLDEFMVEYSRLLEDYHHEVAGLWREADQACKDFEDQLMQLVEAPPLSKAPGGDVDQVGGAADPDELLVGADEKKKKLKAGLKARYAEPILRLKEELTKKRKKGKLPNAAITMLKDFWDKHLNWPYPKESEKKKLSQETKLDVTQINNWFINQRKRHWHKHFPNGMPPNTPEEARIMMSNSNSFANI